MDVYDLLNHVDDGLGSINGCSPVLLQSYTGVKPHGLPLLSARRQLIFSGHAHSFTREHLG